MIFSQAIKKRKAFCLDEAGHERDKRSEDDFDPAAVVAAIKSTKMSMELSSRELAVLNVKKSVIEMHSLLGVISMLRDRKMLTGQACSRALNDVPVGMLSKPSPSQATSLKSECFKKASSFLALSISESMQCIEHRRLYAAGVGSMKRRWQLSIRKPVLRQVDSAAYDSAVVDCSYSLNGGKYTGDAWREVLHVGPEGPLLRTIATLPVQPRYTLQLSIVHKRNGIVSAVSLWELLHLNDSEFPRSTGSSQTHLLLEQLQHSFCMRSHDALCREVFDQLVAEVLQCAFSASVVHGISGAKVKHIFVDDSHADPSLLLMEKLVSSFEVISLSRVNVTVLLSETHFLCVELIDIESATLEPHSKPLADSAPTPTPFLWRRKKAHSTEDDVKMDVEAESNSSGCFPNYLRNSLSSGLLCFAFSTLKSWELQQINKDGNGNRRDETARVRDESRVAKQLQGANKSTLHAVLRLVHFHIAKYKIDSLLESKLQPTLNGNRVKVSWVSEPDSLFCVERSLILFCRDATYELSIRSHSVSVVYEKLCGEPPALKRHIMHYEGIPAMMDFISSLITDFSSAVVGNIS